MEVQTTNVTSYCPFLLKLWQVGLNWECCKGTTLGIKYTLKKRKFGNTSRWVSQRFGRCSNLHPESLKAADEKTRMNHGCSTSLVTQGSLWSIPAYWSLILGGSYRELECIDFEHAWMKDLLFGRLERKSTLPKTISEFTPENEWMVEKRGWRKSDPTNLLPIWWKISIMDPSILPRKYAFVESPRDLHGRRVSTRFGVSKLLVCFWPIRFGLRAFRTSRWEFHSKNQSFGGKLGSS